MRWKTPITLLVLLGVLLGAAYYGWQTVISPQSGTGGTSGKAPVADPPKCVKTTQFKKGQKIPSKDVTVNVYNAGATAGLASATLQSLHSRGFGIGVADNAPSGMVATNVTIVTKDRSLPEVQLVASQFQGRVAFAKGGPLAAGVNVVVGDSFVGLDSKAKSYLRLHHSIHTCTTVGASLR